MENEIDDLLERLGLRWPVRDPHHPAVPGRQDIVADAVLGAAVEHGERLVDDQELRPLDQRPRDAELLALGRRQTAAGDADIVL